MSDHFIEYVDDYLHGVLTEEQSRKLQQHCDQCAICQAALAEARKRHAALHALPPLEASQQLVAQTEMYVADVGPRRERRWRIVSRSLAIATAASILVIGGAHAYFYTMRPTPYDLRILGQSRWLPDSPAAIRIGLFDQRSGRAIGNVDGQVELRRDGEQLTLGKFTTRRDGTASPQFRLPNWPDGKYQLVVTTSPHGESESLTDTVRLRRSWKLMLSADKPIYKPGDTIHLRALGLRRPDLKPVAGHDARFTITDPKGNMIFKQADVTSRFGIVAADCPLASELIEGDYTIACQVGDTQSERTVRVERYVLPKFRVDVQLQKPYYLPGEQVTGRVMAGYFFGKPVTDATVKIAVTTPEIGTATIYESTLTADAQGTASFDFRLPEQLVGREQTSGSATFRVSAEVSDTAGQVAAGSASRVVAADPIQVTIVPESPMLLPGVSNVVYVLATFPDGEPAKTSLVVSGFDEPLATDESGLARLEVTPSGDRVILTVKASDADGRTGRGRWTQSVGNLSTGFLIRTNQAVYDGGDTIELTAIGGGVEPVFVDLLKDGQTMLSTTVDMTEGRGELPIDLPAELFGSVQLVAYRFGPAGLPVRQSRTMFVRQANAVTIDVQMDKDEYRPGSNARLKFQLQDDDGNPAPGAISVAAVDEAVFSVLGPQLGLERTFFQLDEQLLAPVYTIYPWSPFDIPSDDRSVLTQALFANTATALQGSEAVPGRFVAGRPDDANWSTSDPLLSDDSDAAFTLVANSFPKKQTSVELQRRQGLYQVALAWRWLAGLFVLACLSVFAAYRPRAFLISLGIGLPVLTVGACCVATLWSMMMMTESHVDFATTEAVDAYMMNEAPTSEAYDAPVNEDGPGGASTPRVREWFPETLLWRPELITDDDGVATLEISPLADSITTWRLSASAVTAQGQLGAAQQGIRVFQPFFVDVDLPVAFTRHDEVSLPIVAYNYLDQPQQVQLTLDDADWFERLDDPAGDAGELSLDLAPGEVRSLHVRMRMVRVGRHTLKVVARGGDISDAVRRQVDVVPNGVAVEQLASGSLDQPFATTIDLPDDMIPDSATALVKLYPSTFSQLVEGLDAIFRMPHGCFEQTSSTTYPNVLALDYLRRTNQSAPAVEATARQYIHLGYQRLLTFEVPGGGFDWYGNPPAHPQLTAYGLMEFEDMARVHDVDPALIARTRQWLLTQRAADGTWPARGGLDTVGSSDVLGNTAYIAWAVFHGDANSDAAPTITYLRNQRSESIDNPYALSLIINALSAMRANAADVEPFVARLNSLRQTSDDGKLTWWQLPESQTTLFYGNGRGGDVEATAMAALALMEVNQHSSSVKGALRWIIANKDAEGTWHSTQATVLALKALLNSTEQPLGDERPRQIVIELNGNPARTVDIPVDQFDVVQQIDLTSLLDGPTRLSISEPSQTGTAFQFVLRHYVESPNDTPVDQSPLTITIDYDRMRLTVDERVTAVATISNQMDEPAPMVMVDLPIPPGFTIERGELDELVGSGSIAKYEIANRQAIVYLRQMLPNGSVELRYRLRAAMPVKVVAPVGETYLYYTPEIRGQSSTVSLEVTET